MKPAFYLSRDERREKSQNYTISTTGNTYIDGDKGNSALEGEPFNHNTGEAPIREGFEFNPEAAIVEGFNPESRDGSKAPIIGIFDPGFDEDPVIEGEAAIGAEVIASSSDRLFGVYGARGQGGNLPWRTANDDYSRAGIDAAGVNEETGFVELDEHCWFRHWLQRFEHHQ